MARRDNAPVGNTCPLIDEVDEVLTKTHNELDSIISDLETYIHPDYTQKINNLVKELYNSNSDKNSPLEKIRSANSDLRDWGNEMYDKYIEIESENEYLKRKISDLEEKVSSLNDEIKDLESEVSELS